MKKIYLIPIGLSMILWSCGGSEEESSDSHNTENDQTEEVDTTATVSEDAIEEEIVEEEEELDCDPFKLYAYLSDPDEGATNVRKSPGGDVLTTLAADDECELTIDQVENGWFRVIEIYSFNEGDNVELPEGSGWIHGSVIGLGTRNYGSESIDIYHEADVNSDLKLVLNEETFVRPLNVCNDMVKIKFNYMGDIVTGWIENKWLCGSAVTTCS